MENEDLVRLQQVEMNIMDFIHHFCKENDIRYSVAGGNMIGIIRHQGFIPWDDDFDIILDRKDYDRFLEAWVNTDSFYLEKEGIDSKVHINHSKVCRNGTVFSSYEELKEQKHHGIWVDVFAFDRIPNNPFKAKIFVFFAKMRIVFTRKTTFSKGNAFQMCLSKILLKFPNQLRYRLRKVSENYIRKYSDVASDYSYICCSAPYMLKYRFPRQMFDSFELMKYESSHYYVSSMFDEVLRTQFNDYMELPPEGERTWKHKPDVLDFGDYSF